MNEGFKKVPVSDPSKLTNFIEGTSGSVLAILSVTFYLKLFDDMTDVIAEFEQHPLLQRPG